MNKENRTHYIAAKIIELRNSVQWSQSELARRTQVTSAAISQIEKGDRMPTWCVLEKVAAAFHVPVSELTGESSSSATELNENAQRFYRKFGDIEQLSEADQKIIHSLVQRFKAY
jgi:transcriptional regulator with XRE-family HTH domain